MSLLGGRHPAQRRLAFEELLAHQLSACACCVSEIQSDPAESARGSRRALERRFVESLPFALTGAQRARA